MQAIDFNDGWSYRHLDADESFTAVRLPHDAMIGEPRHEDAPGGVNTGWFDGRDYEYVKTYAPGPELAGRLLLLEFEGVYHNAEVWVDGAQLVFRPYGYTNFRVDVTDALAAGEPHEIRVVARNADQPNSRWYSGAGIYRPVTLWAGDAGHILPDGITVRTVSATPLPADGPADAVKADAVIEASIETTASGTVAIDIIDTSGAVVANVQAVTRDIQPTGRGGEADVVPQGALAAALDAGANAVAVARIEVPDAALWDCDHPNLYRCVVRFAGDDGSRDESETTFGVRTLAWGDDGLLLNGRRVIIQGACIHHDNGVLGACAYADAVERKVRLLRACGYNAVRSAHNPCSRALLDVCDRLGVLVMDEYIDHWYIHKTQHDYVDYFNDWWRRDLNDMVRKDRSHPSVVLYSTGNEVSETAQPKGIALTQAMTDHLHGLDPTCDLRRQHLLQLPQFDRHGRLLGRQGRQGGRRSREAARRRGIAEEAQGRRQRVLQQHGGPARRRLHENRRHAAVLRLEDARRLRRDGHGRIQLRHQTVPARPQGVPASAHPRIGDVLLRRVPLP